jgi:hypothetical protein
VANPVRISIQQISQEVDHWFAWSSESSLLERSAQPSKMSYVLQSLRCLQTAWSAIPIRRRLGREGRGAVDWEYRVASWDA